jgi:hypothetical protein
LAGTPEECRKPIKKVPAAGHSSGDGAPSAEIGEQLVAARTGEPPLPT